MSPKNLTILFTPINALGHINACHGIAETLKERGHRVVFALDIEFKGKLSKYGFEEKILELPESAVDKDRESSDMWADFVYKFRDSYKRKPIEIQSHSTVVAFDMMFENNQSYDSQYKSIISELKPDIIIIDSIVGSPTLTHSDIPWVKICSAQPLMFFRRDDLPPNSSGLPINGNKNEWKEFKTKYDQIFYNLHNKISHWYVSAGAPALSTAGGSILFPESEFLNIYIYPKELDYKELQPLSSNWHRVDSLQRTVNDRFTIPESLAKRPGKLIFFSLGSFNSSDFELMVRLTAILGKSEHKFIVSKGPLHDRYELSDNMFGQQFVPQMAVLPLVDLVVTHGGNNTVTEAFYFGKPMLVMPVSGDQFDNAQRIEETGLGARLSPYNCTEEELLTTVDKLVNDLDLAKHMKAIGERIRSSNHKQVVSEMIERLVEN